MQMSESDHQELTMQRLRKYLVIQYNTPRGFVPKNWAGAGRPNLDRRWLDGRLELFIEYCTYSLEQQTHKDFELLIAFDRGTEREDVEAVCAAASGVKTTPLFVGEGEPLPFCDFIALNRDAEFVAVTRLDSDDALAPTFMAEVERRARLEIAAGSIDRGPLFLTFSKGIEHDARLGTFGRRRDAFPAFTTLIQRLSKDSLVDVFFTSHRTVAFTYDAIVVGTLQEQWCVVIHGDNVMNRIKGDPIAMSPFDVGRTKRMPPPAHLPQRGSAKSKAPKLALAERTVGNLFNLIMGRPMVMVPKKRAGRRDDGAIGNPRP